MLKLNGFNYFDSFEDRKADELFEFFMSQLHKVNDLGFTADGVHLCRVNGGDR